MTLNTEAICQSRGQYHHARPRGETAVRRDNRSWQLPSAVYRATQQRLEMQNTISQPFIRVSWRRMPGTIISISIPLEIFQTYVHIKGRPTLLHNTIISWKLRSFLVQHIFLHPLYFLRVGAVGTRCSANTTFLEMELGLSRIGAMVWRYQKFRLWLNETKPSTSWRKSCNQFGMISPKIQFDE